ncbi:hypothetical protein M1N51_00675 [Peptococcaceae bacterium]|nr:hypothetical protein [Peptococcaceae bacterium]
MLWLKEVYARGGVFLNIDAHMPSLSMSLKRSSDPFKRSTGIIPVVM